MAYVDHYLRGSRYSNGKKTPGGAGGQYPRDTVPRALNSSTGTRARETRFYPMRIARGNDDDGSHYAAERRVLLTYLRRRVPLCCSGQCATLLRR